MSSNEIIRQLAYEMWEAEGKPEGQCEKHWESARTLAASQNSGGETDNKIKPLGPFELQEPLQPDEPNEI